MHIAVVGATGTGKSRLAKQLVDQVTARGRAALVCDPHGTRWPRRAVVLESLSVWVRWLRANEQVFAVCDEAAEVLGASGSRESAEHGWVATGSRKWGHRVTFIWQRWPDLARRIRGQCSTVYAFRQHVDDARLIAREFAVPVEQEIAALPNGAFLRIASGQVMRGELGKFSAKRGY